MPQKASTTDKTIRISETPGLYIHVPFCKTKCPYCDFYSVTDLSIKDAWLHALQIEMDLYRYDFGTFETLYIGGGTPTVLSDDDLGNLFDALHARFTFSADAEITIEANPDDITKDRLIFLRSLGANRLSVGVQSFEEDELRFLKRRHAAAGAERALSLVTEAGFTNFGIDLMYGLPGQTDERWLKTLRKALAFEPTHLSCYELTLEETTVLGKMKMAGQFASLTEEEGQRFFLLTSRFLQEHGFVHYEISNFARGDEYCSRHNRKYWRHAPYLGLGPGAHSFQDGVRWWSYRSVEQYCTALEGDLKPVGESETLSSEQLRLERLFLGLRTREGVTMHDAFGEFSSEPLLSQIKKSGLVTTRDNRIVPTVKGFLVADRLPLMFPG
ncbi:MAG: Oxygen-independent coproporphyrinogen-III oxidase 1 [Syntrophorhabdus sp. PtaU1.Bin002]|nr:MAG: Oxygen-independent coproporphyrinogen-III oxidase 1 [Syntrophorhabdus sp. PtaU1.Bin002]